METVDELLITRTTKSNLAEVKENLGFGSYISDHMFRCIYENGQWQTPEILPFQNLSLSPATLALHYGQSIFEGMKAFRMADGRISLFRVDKHYERLSKSLDRMCMPRIPQELFHLALKELITLDQDWVPKKTDNALYIRPFMFASEARFGVKVAEQYNFIIFTGPVGMAYSQPIRVKVERHYSRAARGGTGFAKCAGNYGGAFYPTQLAREEGFDQLLWTDASEHEYIEESGMMNAMFVINGKVVTAPLSDSILDGITRDSLIQVAGMLNIPVEERPISVNELKTAITNGTLTEAFGAGTAAVVAPIKTIAIDGTNYDIPDYSKNAIMFQLKNKLEAIRTGLEGPHDWNWILT